MLDRLPPFERRSVALALYRMLAGPRFDACTLRTCLAVAAPAARTLDARRERLDALRLYHCTPYADLPEGVHAEIAEHTVALVEGRSAAAVIPLDAFLADLAAVAGLAPVAEALLVQPTAHPPPAAQA